MTDQIRFHFDKFLWIEEQSETDLCAHGLVQITIGTDLHIEQDDLCLTVSALYLLRTLKADFDSHLDTDDLLLPHCGHTWLPTDSGVYILPGCPIGISWNVKHDHEFVQLSRFHNSIDESGISTVSSLIAARVTFDSYKRQVLGIVEAVMQFHDSQPPRSFYDAEARAGHGAFWDEFHRLQQEAK